MFFWHSMHLKPRIKLNNEIIQSLLTSVNLAGTGIKSKKDSVVGGRKWCPPLTKNEPPASLVRLMLLKKARQICTLEIS